MAIILQSLEPECLEIGQLPSTRFNLAQKSESSLPSFYSVLSISPSATTEEIKSAYHTALLRNHPDKRIAANGIQKEIVEIDILKQAYLTLSSPDSRASYDSECARRPHAPRPAQVVSLEDFSEIGETVSSPAGSAWEYSCRCGGLYVITEQQMERDRHLVGCNSCSEVVWVGYQAIDEDEDPHGTEL
ncbi:hypothetical protein NLI96_g294 [Meripilus lineatus]|uniref:Diphthamide biosynthesis protein 4 n=1 Tax=Meripilus lineatus TaxID=2056292 RepID=A0AAD5YM52_9APHY|nr:hypothetical protein NLI96_g294 [Physisporinus lineatus]